MDRERFEEAKRQLVEELDDLFPGQAVTVMRIAMRIEDMISAATTRLNADGEERG